MTYDMTNQICQAFGWLNKDGTSATHSISRRDAKIISHYNREVAEGHMDTISAFNRACGDIRGRNYHASRQQRGRALPHEAASHEETK